MEKGEAAAIPAPGQVFAVISDKGKWKLHWQGLAGTVPWQDRH